MIKKKGIVSNYGEIFIVVFMIWMSIVLLGKWRCSDEAVVIEKLINLRYYVPHILSNYFNLYKLTSPTFTEKTVQISISYHTANKYRCDHSTELTVHSNSITQTKPPETKTISRDRTHKNLLNNAKERLTTQQLATWSNNKHANEINLQSRPHDLVWYV